MVTVMRTDRSRYSLFGWFYRRLRPDEDGAAVSDPKNSKDRDIGVGRKGKNKHVLAPTPGVQKKKKKKKGTKVKTFN
eukprot:6148307-Pyramimonas_sp.AAC.1